MSGTSTGWRARLATQNPAASAAYDQLDPVSLAAVHDAATGLPTAGRFASLLALIVADGPEIAALVQALIAAFTAACLLLSAGVAASAAADARPPASTPPTHRDARGMQHKLNGLKPLSKAHLAALRATVLRREPVPQPPTPIRLIDMRSQCPPVLDQDGYNCCAGCSGTMGHRLAEILAGNPDPDDSVADLYDRVDGGQDAGADLDDCVNAMTANGVAPASIVPEWQIPIETEVPGIAAARVNNPLEHAQFLQDEPAMLAAVEAGTPVYFGIIVTNRFNPDASGYIGPYGGLAEGGHAVLAIGVSATAAGHAYIVRNSWGAGWGDGGNCLLDSSWAQPSVYGAFALQGERRGLAPPATFGTTGSTQSFAGCPVDYLLYKPNRTPPDQIAAAIANSATGSILFASWHLASGTLTTALENAAQNGISVRGVLRVTGNSNQIARLNGTGIVASGGTVHTFNTNNSVWNNFVLADANSACLGNAYYSPAAVQNGQWLAVTHGTRAAQLLTNQYNTLLVGSGTLADDNPILPIAPTPGPTTAPPILCAAAVCPTCPTCPYPWPSPPPPLPPPPEKPQEVNIQGWGFHFVWTAQRRTTVQQHTRLARRWHLFRRRR